MTPESQPDRRGIESRVARVESDIANLNNLLRAVAPLVGDTRELAEAQRGIRASFEDLKHEWRDDVRHFDESIEQVRAEIKEIRMERREDKLDSRNYRRTLIGIGIAAILSPVGTLCVALLQGSQ